MTTYRVRARGQNCPDVGDVVVHRLSATTYVVCRVIAIKDGWLVLEAVSRERLNDSLVR